MLWIQYFFFFFFEGPWLEVKLFHAWWDCFMFLKLGMAEVCALRVLLVFSMNSLFCCGLFHVENKLIFIPRNYCLLNVNVSIWDLNRISSGMLSRAAYFQPQCEVSRDLCPPWLAPICSRNGNRAGRKTNRMLYVIGFLHSHPTPA